MAETQHNEQAVSIDAANWVDGVGFTNDAELAILDSQQTLIDLDRTGNTTTGILYLHVRGGSPIIGPIAGHLKVEFKAAYTTESQFVWDCDGGECYLEVVTLAANKFELTGSGTVRLFGSGTGTLADIAVSGNVNCYIDSSLSLVSKVWASGNSYVELDDDSSNLPDVDVSGSAFVYSKRRCTLWTAGQNSRLKINNPGAAATTGNISGNALFEPVVGDTSTVNQSGGRVNERAAREKLTLGGTAYNVTAAGLAVPINNTLLTVSNVTRTFEAGASAFGGGQEA
tara:strand:+ start:2523 stop:3374 length:852 start_codon:yes stop_codon:yes gene_type:complete